ncbi:class I mannose-6-phosphate isomerase [Micromonospora echinofusca]|uniref:Mannose-6-phosphate isomerase n=1 Tax=Micromonospora echinofusca TaxID=47858 RepID=A0ABS3W091_MICEH|nr:class I mannose-6-phosphate isomerase [Micromonospora echinofusca]MBO4210131.1 mannose-6-phosphate isomerase [Micromonospora echinofusca]
MKPLRLTDNRVPVYYAGGRQISEFRGNRPVDGPEDWVGSLSALPAAIRPPHAPPDTGVSRTPAGSLRDLVAADPTGWLGPVVADAFAGQSGLLVKLLDAGERLPVHCHPTREFARTHLGSLFGKTEGWIVLRARPGARVWLGLRDPVTAGDWRAWTAAQNADAMLAAMNDLPVRPGQVLYVPAGLPHAIGPGVLIAELQEPTSFSVLAEHTAFGVGPEAATLGLGWDLALSCFDLAGYAGRLTELTPDPTVLSRTSGGDLVSLFAPRADTFFRAWQVTCTETVTLPEASFAVLVVTAGAGRVAWDGGVLPIVRGDTVVAPYAAGPLRFDGAVTALVCLPPQP